jgi:hypothetical protein
VESAWRAVRINKIDGNTGAVIWRAGTQGSGPDQFYGPAGIALDSAGSIFVADTYNARIQKLAPRPHAIAIDALGNVYVVDPPLRRVQKFSNTGVYLGKFGSAGPGPDMRNKRISKFGNNGASVSTVGGDFPGRRTGLAR